MTVIWILIALFIGAAIGFTACALLSVERAKPRLPDNLSRQMNPPPICKAELQAVNLEALLTFPFGWEPVGENAHIEIAEEFGRILLKGGHLLITEHKDGINMETTYKATARVLKPKEDPDQ